MVRRNHVLTPVPDGYDIRRIRFPQGRRWAASVPFGDVYTAGVSTSIPNITVYSAASLPAALMMRFANPLRPLLARPSMQKRLTSLVTRMISGGPDAQARAEQRTEFWGEVIDANGRSVSLGLTAPNVYALTVMAALEIAAFCSAQDNKGGYYTPSMLLGADFVTRLPGVTAMVET